MSDPAQPSKGTARGWLTVYAAAFVVMIAAGLLLGVAAREFLQHTTVLWFSTGLSGLAIVLAIVAVAVPRRR